MSNKKVNIIIYILNAIFFFKINSIFLHTKDDKSIKFPGKKCGALCTKWNFSWGKWFLVTSLFNTSSLGKFSLSKSLLWNT